MCRKKKKEIKKKTPTRYLGYINCKMNLTCNNHHTRIVGNSTFWLFPLPGREKKGTIRREEMQLLCARSCSVEGEQTTYIVKMASDQLYVYLPIYRESGDMFVRVNNFFSRLMFLKIVFKPLLNWSIINDFVFF